MKTVQELALPLPAELTESLRGSSAVVTLIDFEELSQGFIPHFHPYAVAGKILSGCRCCRVQSLKTGQTEQSTLEAGDLVLFFPGQIHSCLCDDGSLLSYRAVQIPADLFTVLIQGAGGLPSIYKQADYETLSQSFTELWLALQTHTPDAFRQMERFFKMIRQSDLCLKTHPESRQNQDASLIQDALNCLEKNLSDSIHLPDLWRALGLSRSAFYRKWSSALFIAPLQYRNCLRVERSEQLLSAGLSQAQSAAELGWSDQSDFARWYVRIHGYTPGDFCRAVRHRKT